MTDRLEIIRIRLFGAGAQGWQVKPDPVYSRLSAIVVPSPDAAPDEPYDDYVVSGICDDETADLLVNAPDDLRWCVSEIERLRAKCGEDVRSDH